MNGKGANLGYLFERIVQINSKVPCSNFDAKAKKFNGNTDEDVVTLLTLLEENMNDNEQSSSWKDFERQLNLQF
ncbi:hypothetical protein I4U23_000917 [Adineta vaga]|nr:hypothetical protein I4U23_000917 [Adineta vaga]